METWIIVVLNGLSYGLLLFLLSSGLTLVFGMMRVLNLAHGSFYMLGAYLGYSATCLLGMGIGWALVCVPCIVGVLGFVFDRYLIHSVQKQAQKNNLGQTHLSELLLTYGVALVIFALVQWVWGKSPVPYFLPQEWQGSLQVLQGLEFPKYRILMMLIALGVLIAMWSFLHFFSWGAMIKAATQNLMMLEMLGVNVRLYLSTLFAVGCGLAGLAGVLGGMAYVTEPAMAQSIGMLLFVIIVIGGLGSLKGAFYGSLLIGFFHSAMVSWNISLAELLSFSDIPFDSFWRLSTAQIAPLFPFALMVIVLWLRPEGLYGQKDKGRS